MGENGRWVNFSSFYCEKEGNEKEVDAARVKRYKNHGKRNQYQKKGDETKGQ